MEGKNHKKKEAMAGATASVVAVIISVVNCVMLPAPVLTHMLLTYEESSIKR